MCVDNGYTYKIIRIKRKLFAIEDSLKIIQYRNVGSFKKLKHSATSY